MPRPSIAPGSRTCTRRASRDRRQRHTRDNRALRAQQEEIPEGSAGPGLWYASRVSRDDALKESFEGAPKPMAGLDLWFLRSPIAHLRGRGTSNHTRASAQIKRQHGRICRIYVDCAGAANRNRSPGTMIGLVWHRWLIASSPTAALKPRSKPGREQLPYAPHRRRCRADHRRQD